MIKLETIGMLDRVVVNPVLTSANAVANYTFITDNGNLYLVANTITGDNAYVDDVTIPAGEYLNGHLIKSIEGQKLVIDEKHIKYGAGKDYDDIVLEDADASTDATILTVDSSTGKLAIAQAAPASGIYFKVTDKCRLTGKAVKALIIVVDKDTVSNG